MCPSISEAIVRVSGPRDSSIAAAMTGIAVRGIVPRSDRQRGAGTISGSSGKNINRANRNGLGGRSRASLARSGAMI